MKKFLLICVLCGGSGHLRAQSSIPAILQSVEQNNTTLKALRADGETQKLNNRTNLNLADPEVEFGYMWGDPKHTGPRKNYAVRQELDMAVISGSKRQSARERNNLIGDNYRNDRMELLLQAEQLCISAVYCNRRSEQLKMRKQTAEKINELYQKMFRTGEIGKPEQNKAALNTVKYQGELERNEIEKQAILAELSGMNGGTGVMLSEKVYSDKRLPEDFESWFTTTAGTWPALAVASRQTSVEKRNIRQTRTESLPSLTIGYAQEDVPEQSFKGATIGLSIPLWSKRNKLKSAKSAYLTAQMNEQDLRTRLHARLSGLYRKAESLQRTTGYYRKALKELNNIELSFKALKAGEISLQDYLTEAEMYYDTIDLLEQSEYEYAQTLSELLAVEL